MAINAAKQLLDELMGRERDLAPNEKRSSLHWGDPTVSPLCPETVPIWLPLFLSFQVCKHYLINFCPNSLFTNTKADIGPCNLVHDDYVKREYQSKATKWERRQFEDEFIRFCQAQLNEVERKIKRAKQRLEMSQLEKNQLNNSSFVLSDESQEKISKLNEQIETLLEEIERLGCEGMLLNACLVRLNPWNPSPISRQG